VLRTNATVAHRSPAFRLRPDALRLPNSLFIKNSKIQEKIAMPVRQNQTG
jgi:hypothetical protein